MKITLLFALLSTLILPRALAQQAWWWPWSNPYNDPNAVPSDPNTDRKTKILTVAFWDTINCSGPGTKSCKWNHWLWSCANDRDLNTDEVNAGPRIPSLAQRLSNGECVTPADNYGAFKAFSYTFENSGQEATCAVLVHQEERCEGDLVQVDGDWEDVIWRVQGGWGQAGELMTQPLRHSEDCRGIRTKKEGEKEENWGVFGRSLRLECA